MNRGTDVIVQKNTIDCECNLAEGLRGFIVNYIFMSAGAIGTVCGYFDERMVTS
jgi:hypothetical protein